MKKKKILCTILALLMCGAILTAAGVAVWASPEDADPTDTPAVEATAEPVPVTPIPAPEATTAPATNDDAGGISGFEVATVPVLVIICFGIGECVKPGKLDTKWIPTLMIPTGAILGFIAYHVMPDFPASDPITAVGVGVASGLAATGIHQIYKQSKKGGTA